MYSAIKEKVISSFRLQPCEVLLGGQEAYGTQRVNQIRRETLSMTNMLCLNRNISI